MVAHVPCVFYLVMEESDAFSVCSPLSQEMNHVSRLRWCKADD